MRPLSGTLRGSRLTPESHGRRKLNSRPTRLPLLSSLSVFFIGVFQRLFFLRQKPSSRHGISRQKQHQLEPRTFLIIPYRKAIFPPSALFREGNAKVNADLCNLYVFFSRTSCIIFFRFPIFRPGPGILFFLSCIKKKHTTGLTK